MTNPTPQQLETNLRRLIEDELDKIGAELTADRFGEAVRYALEGKGKRLRPMLTILAAGIFGADTDSALYPGLAMEVLHGSTLVHDDIMDRSPTRRGRETVHNRFDEATALLVGDYLIGVSYSLLSCNRPDRLPEMIALHQDTVRQLCEGQHLDMAFESRSDVTVDDYLRMIDGKTAALLGASLRMGGLVAGAETDSLDRLARMGWNVGRAFQIQDDLLDLTADDVHWGKPVGSDLLNGKKTFLVLKALEAAEGDERVWFEGLLASGGCDPEVVPDARERMRRLGVLEAARASVIFHSEQALGLADSLPAGTELQTLCDLIDRMRQRLH